MKKNYRKCLKMKQFSFHNAVMLPKGTDQIANIVDPDQTAFKERSDLDCTVRPYLSVQCLDFSR